MQNGMREDLMLTKKDFLLHLGIKTEKTKKRSSQDCVNRSRTPGMKKRGLFFFSVFLCFVMAFSLFSAVPAFADYVVPPVASGYCGGEGDGTNLTWTLDGEGTITLSGTGAMADYITETKMVGWAMHTDSTAPWYEYRSRIKNVIVEDGVTVIGTYAFGGIRTFYTQGVYPAIRSVSLPDSLTVVGDCAFYGCSDLTGLTLPEGLKTVGEHAFAYCASLESVSIPDGVTGIGQNAFSNCAALKEALIPDSVTDIGSKAFSCCEALTAVTVATGNPSYVSDAFGCLYNKEKTVLIQYPPAGPAAAYCIPQSTAVIGDYAFWGSAGLEAVSIPGSVETIGSSAFRNSGLTDVYYQGGEEQWALIGIGSFNDELLNADVRYYRHMLSHAAPVRENEVPADCVNNGGYDEVVYCDVCGYEISREHTVTALAKGHTPGEAVIENETPAVCTAAGGYDEAVYCIDCAAELSRTRVTVNATGHDWGEWEVVKQATVSEEGLMRRTCANDPSHTEEEIIPKLQPQTSAFQRFIQRIIDFFNNIVELFRKLFRF